MVLAVQSNIGATEHGQEQDERDKKNFPDGWEREKKVCGLWFRTKFPDFENGGNL